MTVKQSSNIVIGRHYTGLVINECELENRESGNFSPSTPIYQNYRENSEKSPVYESFQNSENSEIFINHGKSAIWVERGDFYRAAVAPPLNTSGTPNKPTILPKSPKKSLKNKKRSTTLDSDPYLLIGFDTEFKTPDQAVTKQGIVDGEAKYTVLSYQFHAKSSDGPEWTGVCCPEEGERMTLPEFLIFVLGTGARTHGLKDLPTQIYMVGHFTRADIPAFRDFRVMSDVMRNIRNTFVTGGTSIRFELDLENDNPVELAVGLRDTMLLTPATSKGLAALGDLVGVPKVVLQTEDHDHQWLIENMDYCREHHWEMFKTYAITDATIALRYAERVIALYDKVQGKKRFPMTLSSIGLDILTRKLNTCTPPLFNQLFGYESHRQKYFSKRHNHFITQHKPVKLTEVDRFEKEATECYHGGRNEQFWFGPCFEDDWTDYDLQNAYPTAMSLIGIPLWSLTTITTDVNHFGPTTLGYVDVEFEFPESVRYPVLPVRTDNGIIFPRTGRSRCSAPEVFVAHRLGAKLTIHFGLVVPTNPDIRPFMEFTQDCIKYRAAVGKNSLEGLFWKEIINSTYGKTAQGLMRKRVYDLREDKTELLPPSKITNPYLAAFITSAVRAVLGEMMNGLPADKMVFSCTTDGFLTNASEQDMAALVHGPMYKVFARTRQELVGTLEVVEVKHCIRKPLGWRTRGQATLLSGVVVGDQPDKAIVLAKGGIYLPKSVEGVPAQNKAIIDKFFGRTPESKIDVVGFAGIRDIMMNDADMVNKTVTKRLSMEYDWKRRPHGVATDPVTGHLSFSTRPWDSVAQFIMIRDTWEQYNKERPVCLKTVGDYLSFARFAESRLLVDPHVRRYLSKSSGDIKRLRMAVCSAWKHSRAGLIDQDGGRSAHDFADLLTLCGIACTKTDVENGKKRPFTPNRVPPTVAVKQAIEDLMKVFPTLDEGELLYRSVTDDHLHLHGDAQCPFTSKLVV